MSVVAVKTKTGRLMTRRISPRAVSHCSQIISQVKMCCCGGQINAKAKVCHKWFSASYFLSSALHNNKLIVYKRKEQRNQTALQSAAVCI